MYEGSQISIKTTTGVKSGADALKESRSGMTFLNILGVTGILCLLRLVSERKYVERSLSHQD